MGKESRRRAGGAKSSATDPVGALLEEADDLFAQEEYERALALMRQAYSVAPGSLRAAETLGSALAELGEAAEAATVLRHACELSPHAGHEKFMYLGQLLSGPESVAALRSGVRLLEEAGGKSLAERATLSAALCALVEGIMAEAEGVETCAEECRSLMDRARRLHPASPEPLQALATLRSLQGFPDEALDLLRQSIACWQPQEGSPEASPEAELPSFEFRFEAAKLLLDLDETTDGVVRILEELLEERDDNPEVWFMLALAHHGGCAFARARLCLDQAEQLLNSLTPDDRSAFELELAGLRSAVEESASAWQADGLAAAEAEEEEEEEEEDE